MNMEKQFTENISYKLWFIDSTRFMAHSFSNIANTLSEGIHKIKSKSGHDDEKYEVCGI